MCKLYENSDKVYWHIDTSEIKLIDITKNRYFSYTHENIVP